MKTCNGEIYCEYKTLGGIFSGCNYEGYCDYQAPRDSREKDEETQNANHKR